MPFTRTLKKNELPNIRNSIFWNIGFPATIIIVSIFIFTAQIRSLLAVSNETNQIERSIAGLNRTQRYLLDMETGLRGYIITRNPDFLSPYETSSKNLLPSIQRLQELMQGSPDQVTRINDLLGHINTWLEYAAIKKKETMHTFDFRQVRIAKGKELMDRMRSLIEEMLQVERQKVIDRRPKIEESARSTMLITIVWMCIVGLIFTVVSYRRILRQKNIYDSIIGELHVTRNSLEQAKEGLEKAVEDRTVELRASNTELEAFCYSVSHDLRAPLRGIDGFAQVLVEDYTDKLDADGVKYLNYIRDGVQKMGRLIDDLLLLSRITRSDLKKTKVNLSDVAKSTSKKIETGPLKNPFQIQENITVDADEGLMEIILQNLFSNAYKFSRNNPEPIIKFSELDGAPEKTMFVRDNGVGFDMKYEDKLFRPFSRLHPKVEGTGIGLATVKRIVDKHGGKIWIESQPNKGTTVYFTLPEGGKL